MRIAAGYILEVVIWECLYFAVLVVASGELWLHRKPPLRSRVKILQKVWFPTGFVTGLVGIIAGFDMRGTLGLQTYIPVVIRLLIAVWFLLVPPISCALTWMQQLFLTTSKTLGFEGPYLIGQKEDLQQKFLLVLITFWFIACTLAAILMSITDRLRFAMFIWGYGILIGVTATYLSGRTRKLVIETMQQTSASLRISKNGIGAQEEERIQLERKLLFRKLSVGVVLSGVMTGFCIIGCIYHLTWGWEDPIHTILLANGAVYFPSLIVYLFLCIPGLTLAVLGVHGVLCCCSKARREMRSAASIIKSENAALGQQI
jgi:hypothetical protein